MAAQAARLSLRMQKELKLLLSDPPPGASFPRLSSDSIDALSSIDAQIKGPAGTVYENGVFSVKIRIPDRYPFQPPIVTFATPIYHPNIDTGGRICLDILNLPPKGAWQPSLNISTVLTSIGLLLSDPNPDDGLMCEASREFKYNRQAFDQKARSMTEKFANHEAAENIGINIEAKTTADESKPEATRNDNEASSTNQVSVESSNSQMGIEGPQSEWSETFGRGKKLSLKSSSNTGKRIDIVNEDVGLKKLPRMSEVKMEKKDDRSRFEARSQTNVFYGIENGSFGTSRKKLSLGSKKLCLDVLPQETHSQQESVCGVKETLSQPDSGCCVREVDSESLLHEAVIVLDSEDSDEEEDKKRASLRSKPMLSQKRLGKRKL